MSSNPAHELETLFYPKSIAMVGASPKKKKEWSTGNAFIAASIHHDFSGDIYPVHPSGENVLGFKTYKDIRDIPGEVDLAIFTVPARFSIELMEACAEKGVKFVHLLTAGFTETGRPEHAEAEKRLVEAAQKGGVRIVGPNCMGLYCPEGGLAWGSAMPNQNGPVAFISQSGQLASNVIDHVARQNIGFSKAVSFGNASDLQAHDFLEYLEQDPKTKIIGAYLEGLKNGRAFFEAARRITRKKPLVVWKGGQTEGGSRATRSHTAAIAGSPKIWESLCRQTGIIPVNSIQEAVFTIAALHRMPLPTSNRVAILGGAGGGSVTMTDMAEKAGLSVPHLSQKTIQALEEFVPLAGNSAKNPLDMFLTDEKEFFILMELLSKDPNIDSLIYNLHIEWVYRDMGRMGLNSYIAQIFKAKDIVKKPILVVLESEGRMDLDIIKADAKEMLHEHGIPTFPSFEIAIKVMASLKKYHDFLIASGSGV